MILNINDFFYFDLNTSILFFNKENYNLILEENKEKIKKVLLDDRKKILYEKRIIETIHLIPSMYCDGVCNYCYNENSNNTFIQDMDDIKLQKNMLELETMYDINLKSIRMYGGEPLKNEKLENIINFFINYNKNMIFYISTGLFLTDDLYIKQKNILKRLSEKCNITLGVGVDLGTYPETRLCSYINKEKLLKRCDELIKENIKIVFVNTVTKNTDTNKLFEEIFYLNNKYNNVINKPNFRISVACDALYSPKLNQLDEIYIKLKELYLNEKDLNITSNIFPYLDVINSPKLYKIFSDVYFLKYSSFYCDMFSKMITILPDHTFRHCHMSIDSTITHARKIILDTSKDIIHFDNKDNYIFNKECLNCDYFTICRGGCYYRKKIMKNIKEENKNIYCEWIKKSFELSLYKIYPLLKQNINYIDNLL